MNQRSVPSKLVNFRLSKALLEPFDHICLLSGKTRTHVLSELIHGYVANAGSAMVNDIVETKRNNEVLRKLVFKKAIPHQQLS